MNLFPIKAADKHLAEKRKKVVRPLDQAFTSTI